MAVTWVQMRSRSGRLVDVPAAAVPGYTRRGYTSAAAPPAAPADVDAPETPPAPHLHPIQPPTAPRGAGVSRLDQIITIARTTNREET